LNRHYNHNSNNNTMRFSLASTLVVTLAAQATANSWFGKTGAYSEFPLLLHCFLPAALF
jgi:hypothetical protein